MSTIEREAKLLKTAQKLLRQAEKNIEISMRLSQKAEQILELIEEAGRPEKSVAERVDDLIYGRLDSDLKVEVAEEGVSTADRNHEARVRARINVSGISAPGPGATSADWTESTIAELRRLRNGILGFELEIELRHLLFEFYEEHEACVARALRQDLGRTIAAGAVVPEGVDPIEVAIEVRDSIARAVGEGRA